MCDRQGTGRTEVTLYSLQTIRRLFSMRLIVASSLAARRKQHERLAARARERGRIAVCDRERRKADRKNTPVHRHPIHGPLTRPNSSKLRVGSRSPWPPLWGARLPLASKRVSAEVPG